MTQDLQNCCTSVRRLGQEGGLIPVFCFDQNVQLGYDHDCTGEHMCGGYQQMVHNIDHWPSAEMCFVAIGSLGRADKMS